MTKLWMASLAFLFASTQLARRMTYVFTCPWLVDDSLADPNEAEDAYPPEGRRMIESLIATAKDWISFLINARAA